MAAKKKQVNKPDLSNRPLYMKDLSRQEQKDAESLMSGISETMPEQFTRLAHSLRNATRPTQVASRKRYESAAPQAVRKPMTIDSMAQRRSESFMRGLTGPNRLETEDYSGQEFYFQHRGEIDKIRQEANAPEIPLRNVLGATARLSVRTKPEAEKASAKGLLEAHARGKVDFNQQLLKSLSSGGVSVPPEFHGKQVPFSDIPSSVVGGMIDPNIRGSVTPHLTNVDLNEISKTSMATNVRQAHESLQGTNLPKPTINPKQFSYQTAHELAVPNSPEHQEYKLRAMNLGQVARGEQVPEQLMFDFYGLRDSNEGVLSNEMAMPEDSWMNAVSYDQPSEIKKASGDVNLGAKKGKTKRGRSLSVGAGNKDITNLGIQHAVNTEATSRAAKQVQENLGVGYTVPSMMIQEGVWAETRRELGGDSAFNAQKAKAPKKEKAKKPDPSLFD